MSRDAFRRLALIAGATAYFVAVAAAARWISLWCLVAVPLGAALALAVTVEQQPEPVAPAEVEEQPERPRRLGHDGVPRGFQRVD